MYKSPEPTRRAPWKPYYNEQALEPRPPVTQSTRVPDPPEQPTDKVRRYVVRNSKRTDKKVYRNGLMIIDYLGEVEKCYVFGGRVVVKDGGILRYCIVNSGELIVERGGYAEGVTLHSDATLDVQGGATAINVHMKGFTKTHIASDANYQPGYYKMPPLIN